LGLSLLFLMKFLAWTVNRVRHIKHLFTAVFASLQYIDNSQVLEIILTQKSRLYQ